MGGVATLIESMKNHNVKNIIFSSTAAVYGFPEEIPVNEEAKTNPCNPYGSSKLACETLIKESKLAYDMNYVILRYFNVAGALNENYGLRQKNPTLLIPVVNKSIIEDKQMNVFGDDYNTTKDGTCVRDYINVEDLAQAHLLALKYLLNGGETNYFNLGTQEGSSVKEVFDICEKVTYQKFPVKIQPRRPGDPAILIADNKKAKEVLGWTPVHTLEQSIQTAYNWEVELAKRLANQV